MVKPVVAEAVISGLGLGRACKPAATGPWELQLSPVGVGRMADFGCKRTPSGRWTRQLNPVAEGEQQVPAEMQPRQDAEPAN